MAKLPSDLPQRLRDAGLTVIELDGWQRRGRPIYTGGFNPVGVLNHHTGAGAKGWSRAKRISYARWMFLTGRGPSLPAPLTQLALGPDGEVYVGAAGRANHAGKAKASGSVGSGDGNRIYVGIEWMLSGYESIPTAMYDAGATLNAVLLDWMGSSVQTVSCHYNTSVTGKWDIGDPNGVPYRGQRVLDVPAFRRAVKDSSITNQEDDMRDEDFQKIREIVGDEIRSELNRATMVTDRGKKKRRSMRQQIKETFQNRKAPRR